MKKIKNILIASSLAAFGLFALFSLTSAASFYSDPVNISRTNSTQTGKIALLADGRACSTYTSPIEGTGKSGIYLICQQQDGSWSGFINQRSADLVSPIDRLSFAPQIVVDNLNRPIIAWVQRVEPSKIFVNAKIKSDNGQKQQMQLSLYNINLVRWDGSAWSGLTRTRPDNVTRGIHISARPNLTTKSYSLTLNPLTNRPAVAWQKNDTAEIYFRHFNGTSWTGLTNSVDNISSDGTNNLSSMPSLAYSQAGRPFVAWSTLNNKTGHNEILLKSFRNGNWQGLLGHTFERISWGHAYGTTPALTVKQSQPLVVWMGRLNESGPEKIYLRGWNGSAWRGLTNKAEDTISNGLMEARNPAIAVSLGGKIGVGFTASVSATGNHNVYYTSWSQGSWQGQSGTAFDRISNLVSAENPSLALDNLHRPHMVWQENLSGPGSSDEFYSYAY